MKNAKICIIDDNEAVCDALKFLFDSTYKLSVKTYHDPLLFLEEFSPDWEGCLIIDLFMPRMNGIDLMKKLKNLNSNLNIIIMSGHGSVNAASESIEAGAKAFLTKPFNTEDLLKKVMSLLQIKA